MPRILISVTSDLITDQRVHRTAGALHQAGYAVLVIGRQLSNTALDNRPYLTRRFKLWFTKGPMFYFSYNLRLFLFLLFTKADILFANDLDTLMPNYLCSRMKRIPLIYDSHEYFTGVPELEGRRVVKFIWKSIERWIIPQLTYMITVNNSIASLYKKEYDSSFAVVRNVPSIDFELPVVDKIKFKTENNLPADKPMIILQGNGINIHRGSEELVEAMQHVSNAYLLIAGNGDVIEILKSKVRELHLENKVFFKPRMPYKQLLQYTCCAHLGISFDKPTNINYKLSLPNKLFDYMYCGVPVLITNLPEPAAIVKQHECGYVLHEFSVKSIADSLSNIFSNPEDLNIKRENALRTATHFSWQNEKNILLDVVAKATTSRK
ncbi:MAG: glycosyltransferase [Bacteroidetes bacterium]|nr:glycosyltransferase [Bacteroidota bacterium]